MPRFGVRVWRTTKPIAPFGAGLQRHCQDNWYAAEVKVSCSIALWAPHKLPRELVTLRCSSTVKVIA